MESRFAASTGLNLHGPCCQIAGRLKLYHGLSGIIIAANVRIGRNVVVFQHATIAECDTAKLTIIEDDVLLGAGCVLLNNPHIGKGARIGANAVVVGDVPAGATAVGVPARIVCR